MTYDIGSFRESLGIENQYYRLLITQLNIFDIGIKIITVVKTFSLSLFWLITISAGAQKVKKEDRQLVSNLQAHIQFLSDDKLEGRRTGTNGEKLAAEYISNEFKKLGLNAKGTKEYYQSFDINEGKQINSSTHLLINENNLTLHKDFFPLTVSPNISMEALPSMALQEADMPWFYDLKELIEANAGNPHYDLAEGIRNKATALKKKGASALFIYNSTTKEDGINFDGKDKAATINIPVIYLSKEVAKKYLSDEAATLDVKFKIDIGDKKRYGNNVVGYIDNGAANTVVLGAHFDHLGFGEDGNSMVRNTTGQIHNGADDNASGTAALIELARMLKTSKLKSNNYLFIAFSGEELGLYGSKFFVENPTIELSKINFMINMDMVGRLNDSSKTLTVGGYGTSPSWGMLFSQAGKKINCILGNLPFVLIPAAPAQVTILRFTERTSQCFFTLRVCILIITNPPMTLIRSIITGRRK